MGKLQCLPLHVINIIYKALLFKCAHCVPARRQHLSPSASSRRAGVAFPGWQRRACGERHAFQESLVCSTQLNDAHQSEFMGGANGCTRVAVTHPLLVVVLGE